MKKESIKYLNEKDRADYYEKKYRDTQKELEQIQKEFEQYKKESIKWSVEDFTEMEADGWSITEEQAQNALEDMINNHDAQYGISWDTVEYYIQEYGTKVKEGKELWRKNRH